MPGFQTQQAEKAARRAGVAQVVPEPALHWRARLLGNFLAPFHTRSGARARIWADQYLPRRRSTYSYRAVLGSFRCYGPALGVPSIREADPPRHPHLQGESPAPTRVSHALKKCRRQARNSESAGRRRQVGQQRGTRGREIRNPSEPAGHGKPRRPGPPRRGCSKACVR